MRRLYDSALVRDVSAEIRRVLPEAGVGTDVIAGFPGESTADFAATLALLEETAFTYCHVFPYSRRSGTTAAKASDQLPAATIRERASALRRLSAAKRRAFAAAQVGGALEVLVEHGRDAVSGDLTGYSRNYARVVLAGPAGWTNTLVPVRATACRDDRVLATAEAESDVLAAG
jgi:threonylcarbamoyladenosine tRNA methylthiotransferase MtaB